MKNYTFDMEEYPHLGINGNDFEIKLSDIEIIQTANEMKQKYEKFADGFSNADQLLEAVNDVVGAVDKILGEGAVEKIAGGKPVTISVAIRMLDFVAEKAVEAYAERLAEAYE